MPSVKFCKKEKVKSSVTSAKIAVRAWSSLFASFYVFSVLFGLLTIVLNLLNGYAVFRHALR